MRANRSSRSREAKEGSAKQPRADPSSLTATKQVGKRDRYGEQEKGDTDAKGIEAW